MTVAFLIGVAVPVTLVVLMTTLGVNLRLSELAGVLRRPRLWLSLTLLQFALLLPCALLVVAFLGVEPVLAVTLIAVAASPGGAFSNVFTFLAGGSLALSITLTGASTLLATLVSPVLAAAATGLLGLDAAFPGLDPAAIALDLTLFVFLPLAVGALISRFVPRLAAALRRAASVATALAVIGLVAMSVMVSLPFLPDALPPMLVAGGIFTLCSLGVGAIVSRPLGSGERSATLLEFGIRNLPIALLMMSGAAPDARVVAYLLSYFVVNSTALLALSLVLRKNHQPAAA